MKDGSVTASVKPAISNKTTINFEVELSKPGDFYEFNVDVVNDGDLDAMIESINITPGLTIEQQKYLSYSVTYLDDVPLEVKDILHAKKIRTLKVRVEYLKSVENNELNLNDETLNIKATIKYAQADNTAKESSSNELETKLINVLSGNGTQAGDEIAIGDEHFYVIKNDGENITMLAKYNLLVGNSCTGDGSSYCKKVENETGKQDQTAKGYGTNPRIETVKFSNSKYWGNVANGTYIYNDKASIKNYVDNYQDYLVGIGVEIVEARLISYNELLELGCDSSNNSCSNAPSWLTTTSYWTCSTNIDTVVWTIHINGTMFNYFGYDGEYSFGVHPVIVIPADSI